MATILIIDDEVNLLRLYKKELEKDGHKIVLARSGHDALSRFDEHNPDLVILETRMPDMDGIELMGRLLDKRRTLPIIINSAYRSYKDNYLCWCADAYIDKSSDLGPLKDAVNKSIRSMRKAA